MVRRVALVVVAGLATGTLAACGGGHAHDAGTDAAAATGRVVEVSMTDMAFSPATLTVAAGETVTFRFRNEGAVVHEATVGDQAAQDAHAAEMAQAAAGGHQHDHTAARTVAPGATGTLTHTFATAGTVLLGCHQPGHWEAGMRATITVA